ncbi:hypothetical protein [Planomicrobium okeanokoites]|uniref:hypothetical protein n=1 Tax=Planomicrobium okeanokoites TaxID=244 RepID=UPI0015C4C98D|nr:hypothetical protein [Planomicrobium okeanokoites]
MNHGLKAVSDENGNEAACSNPDLPLVERLMGNFAEKAYAILPEGDRIRFF